MQDCSAEINNRSVQLDELMISKDLSESLKAQQVNGVCLDSRHIKPGNLFIALKGSSDDGRKYISDAVEKGASVILFDGDGSVKNLGSAVGLPIHDLDQKVSGIAANFYQNPSKNLKVIGITGTNGKTSCAQLLAQALVLLGHSCGVIGTLGYGHFTSNKNSSSKMQATGMTTPDAIKTQEILAQFVASGLPYVAMEVSSHGLQQHRVAAVEFDTAMLTNLTHDHLDYHGSLTEYAKAKSRLFKFDSLEYAILNSDDQFSEQVVSLLPECASYITVSAKGELAPKSMAGALFHLSLSSTQMTALGMGIELKVISQNQEQVFHFNTQLLGAFNTSNILLVIASLMAQGFDLEAIVKTIPEWSPIAGRIQLVEHECSDVQVILDYAHTPDALEKALQALKPLTQGSLWCVFGCGGDRDQGKRPIMARVAEALADQIIVTNDNPRFESADQILKDIQSGFTHASYECIPDRRLAIQSAVKHAKSGDLILVAGKGHEEYQIIGDQKSYFSDLDEAKGALSLRQNEKGGVL